jgi:tetratricopeptide (TPR) repeat protein
MFQQVFRRSVFLFLAAASAAFADPGDAVRLTEAGKNLITGGALTGARYNEAIGQFTKAIDSYPNYAPAYYHRGLVYYAKGDYDKALADLAQARKIATMLLAEFSSRFFDYIQREKKAVGSGRKPQEIYTSRGRAFMYEGYDNIARELFARAITIDPNYAVAYFYRGESYCARGDYDEAVADLTRTITINPNYTLAYFRRGESYCARGDYDEAVADLTRTITIDPNYAQAYYHRGRAYYGKRDYDRAVADLNHALKIKPDYREATDLLARVNREKEAAERWQRVQEEAERQAKQEQEAAERRAKQDAALVASLKGLEALKNAGNAEPGELVDGFERAFYWKYSHERGLRSEAANGIIKTGPLENHVLSFSARFPHPGEAQKADSIMIYPTRPLPVPEGYTKGVSVLVYGSGRSHSLNVLVTDRLGGNHVLPMGSLAFRGWRKLTAEIPLRAREAKRAYYDTSDIHVIGFRIDRVSPEHDYDIALDDLRALKSDEVPEEDLMPDTW